MLKRTNKKLPPEIHIDIGSHNTNPAKRKGTAKPNRRSQITGKAPTKRLVARRRANTAPGYFPNPATRDVTHSIIQMSPDHTTETICYFTRGDYAAIIAKMMNEYAAPGVKYKAGVL